MENELFLVRYYWSLLLRKPLHWVIPLVAVLAVGGFVVLQEPRGYLSTTRIAAQSPEMSDALVQSTVTNERLQFFEQRIFARDNLVALADKLGLFAQQRATLTDSQLAERLRRQISLQVLPTNPNDPSSNSAVVTIGFTAETPELAAAGAGEMVQMLIRGNRTARLTEATELRTFLEQEVTNRRAETVQLDGQWNAFVSTNEALLPSRLPIYTSETQELQQELQTIQNASAILAADTRVLETQLALATRPAANVENQLAALRNELSFKQIILSDTHPEIVALRSRIASLEARLSGIQGMPPEPAAPAVTAQSAEGAMLAERIASAQQQQGDYAVRRAVIEDRLTWLRSTIAQMPGVEGEMLALQRRHTAAEENLADMQNRLDTARIGERLETSQTHAQITIIDNPDVPINPTSGNRMRKGLLLVVFGLIAGAGCLVLLDLRDRSIKSKRDLKSILEGATLAVIPDWTPNKSKRPKTGLAALAGLLALSGLTGATSTDLPLEAADAKRQV